MKLAPSDAAVISELDAEKWICLKCIVQKTYKPGQHMPSVTTATYSRIRKMIQEGKVEYSSKEPCRNKLCATRYRSMTHRLTSVGVELKKAAGL
jgi:hypothetical protein